jgi:hypothetical protein
MKHGLKTWIAPALGGSMGLLLGWWCRTDESAPSTKDPSVSKSRSGRLTQSSHRASDVPGPTALAVHGLSKASAARCEERFREIIASNSSRMALDLELVFRRWMEIEKPADLLERLKAEKNLQTDGLWSAPFFEAWAAIDYHAAVEGTRKHGDFSQIRALVAMRRQDAAFLTEQFSVWDYEKSTVVNALADLGRDNPELAKQVAGYKGRNPDANADLIAAVVRGWATKDPKAALTWIQSLGLAGDNLGKAYSEITAIFAKLDPETAASEIQSLGLSNKSVTPERINTTSNQIQLAIGRNSFVNVQELHECLSDAPIDWSKREMIFPPIDHDGWFVTNPFQAAIDAEKLPPGGARDAIMSAICGQWADRSPEEARAYAEKHGLKPPIVSNDPAPEQIHAALASPDSALSGLFTTEANGGDPYQKILKLAEKRAEFSPEDTAEWLVSQPETVSYDRQSAASLSMLLDNTLGYYWARNDARSATEWLLQLPEGPRKSEAWLAMCHYTGEYNPDYAFHLTADLIQGERRLGLLTSNLKRVAEKIGLPAARELLGGAGLSESEQLALGKSLDDLATQPAKP